MTSTSRWSLIALVVLLSACSDGERAQGIQPLIETPEVATADPSPQPSRAEPTPTEPSPTPSPTGSEAFAIPDEITPDYVDRVLNEINRLAIEADKAVIREGEFNDEADLVLMALYADPLLEVERTSYAREASEDPSLPYFAGGPVIDTTEEVISSSDACIAAIVQRDRSQYLTESTDPTIVYTALIRDTQPVAGVVNNETGWKAADRINERYIEPGEEELCIQFE